MRSSRCRVGITAVQVVAAMAFPGVELRMNVCGAGAYVLRITRHSLPHAGSLARHEPANHLFGINAGERVR